jgi:NAD(P)-dependent dehydrogenase (short-subunit alcohol dehydrogenase family)
MKPHLKPLSEQVMVLTGATSGIGLGAARKAAAKGAHLSLAARNEQALQTLTDELKSKGCEVIYTAVDVGSEEDVRHLAEHTINHFGGFDT